jgi:signal transduction histidine kinase
MSQQLRKERVAAAADRPNLDFLAGGGEMGERMRRLDWSHTPLGAPEAWPQSLKTIVRVMLDSRYAMWMLWGADLTFFCNDAYLPTLGLKRDWALGARSDKVWEEIWPDIGPRIEQVLSRGEATWDESLQLFLERSGFPEETYHTFSYSPVCDDDSRIAGMLCVVTEVTERVIGERHLRLLRDLSARADAVETVGDTCNRLCRVLAGYPLDVAFACLYLLDVEQGLAAGVGRTRELPEGVLPPLLHTGATSPWPLAQLLQSETVQEVAGLPQLGLNVPAGPWPDAVQRALMLPLQRAGAPHLSGFLVVGVSPRRALDDTYRAFIALVAAQVAAALADAQAYDSERRRAEELAELDRAKTVFFSNVSHEFRTPLTLLLGPLEEALAAAPQDLPAQRGELEVAHRNALRLLKLVNTLLDFSRIEAGRLQARFEQLNLAALTRDLVSGFRSAIDRAGLQLVVECEDRADETWVDRDMWEKIVLNLVSNAFKYTLQGKIGVRLTSTSEYVELEVSDTGIGIAAEAQVHLFERFYRVPGVEGRSQEGSGIGLSLVNELVKLHDGRIHVDSEPGRGSTFTVRLPCGSAHLPAERLISERRQGRRASSAPTFASEALRWLPEQAGNELIDTQFLAALPALAAGRAAAPPADAPLILLADDNADMREYVARLLAPRFRVVTARHGEEALRIVSRELPDLILSDVMMPRLDGFGLLKQIRADARTSAIPVVLLSARAGEEAKIEGLDAGADDYLIKPFAARELLARVNGQLALARMRREMQSALVQSEQRFRVALGSAAVGFTIMRAVHGADGQVIDFEWQYANAAAERLTARPSSELQGRRVSDVLPGYWQRQPAQLQLFARVLADGLPRDIEVDLGSPRTPVWIHNSVARLGDGLVVWFADITERKRAETALRDADRRKDEFLAMLAHELRNPLAPIRNAVDLLARLVPHTDPRLPNAVALASRQVTQLNRLVDDLLDVSRITRGRIALQRRSLELASVIAQALEMVQPQLRDKRHRVSVTTSGYQPLHVNGDPARLVQCLVNVLLNAAKYTDPGGEIRVHAYPQAGRAIIEVCDSGVGMSPELLPRIFDLFVQGERSLDRSQGGLGVGLSVVKRLVEMHDGEVTACSAGVGHGSTIEIRLPLAEGPVVAAPAAAAIKSAPLRIMIVDDNEDSANSLASLLQLDGHETETAYAPQTALERIPQFAPSLVLLDIGLPGMDGYEVARRLRLRPELAGVRLIAVTGYGQAEDQQRARAAGFDDHLIKPVDLMRLRTIIAELPRPKI